MRICSMIGEMRGDDNTAARRKRANEIRLNAIREKSRKTEIQQDQIKKSLHSLDESAKTTTHIQFSDSDEDENDSLAKDDKPGKAKADDILGFEDGDSGDEIRVSLKPQFQGKEGGKLLELQSIYGNDSRFRLDKRFAEEDSTSSTDNDDDEKVDASKVKDMKSELNRNLQVLNQVIGRDVSKEQANRKTERFIDVSSRRYDPTKGGHFELKVEQKKDTKPKKKKKKLEIETVDTDSRKFFETSTTALQKAFAAKNEEDTVPIEKDDKPFSFLTLLGRPEVDEEEIKKKTEVAEASDSQFAISSLKKDIPKLGRKFKYDSSESEDEDEDEDEDETEQEVDLQHEKTESQPTRVALKSTRPSTFFFASAHDPRIVEGVKDFCWHKTFEQIQKEWLDVKDTLIKDYKKKHRDAKRKARKAKYEAKLSAASCDV